MEAPNTLRLIKMSISGTILYERDFTDLQAIAKFLKISVKNAELIQQSHRFPKGKTRVLNKYIIRNTPPPPKNPFEVSFD
jgi:hypothetical protein